MTELAIFDYAGHEVRSLDQGGKPWFVVTDVARILGYRDAASASRLLRDQHQGYADVRTPGGMQRMIVCNEEGVYRLILRSSASNAEQVQDWITDEVLPAIRRTGTYAAATAPSAIPSHSEALRGWAAELEARELAEAKVAEMAPKVEVAERLLDADGDLSVADTAKALTRAGVKVGESRLFAALKDKGWIYRAQGDGRWRVYQAVIESGHMSVLPTSHYHPKTGVLVLDPPQPRVTPKGLQRLLADHGALVPVGGAA